MGGTDRKKGYEGYLLGKKKTDCMKLMEKREVELCHNSSPSMDSMAFGIQ